MGRRNAAQRALLWGCESGGQQVLHSPEPDGQGKLGATLQSCRLVVRHSTVKQPVAAESGELEALVEVTVMSQWECEPSRADAGTESQAMLQQCQPETSAKVCATGGLCEQTCSRSGHV